MSIVTSVAELEELYQPAPVAASRVKVSDRITAEYATLINASPFVALSTVGPEGLDCSPRGDTKGFVRISDPRTLMMPDRRGNNRIDSLRNIVRDPRCALLFLIPGSGTTLRVNGKAQITTDRVLLDSFIQENKAPRTVIVIEVDEIYFQCARAILRSELWNPDRHVDAGTLPTAGQMLASLSKGEVGGDGYDQAWPERAKQTLW